MGARGWSHGRLWISGLRGGGCCLAPRAIHTGQHGTLLTSYMRKKLTPQVDIVFPGGELAVRMMHPDAVQLAGPATFVFAGELRLPA